MMFASMPQITFFARSNNDAAQTHSLYYRVTVNHTKKERSTGEKLSPAEWDQQTQSCPGDSPRAIYLNTLVDSLRYKLKTKALLYDDEDLTAEQLILSLTKKPKDKQFLLHDLVNDYIEDQRSERSQGTIKNHQAKLKNLMAYEIYTKKRFTPLDFDLPEAARFKKWFQIEKNTKNVTTANRNVSFFKEALQYAVEQGKIKRYELSLFTGEKDPIKPPVYLTYDEILQLINHQFAGSMLQRIKDLYLFQISTGLSYGDLYSDFEITGTENGKVLLGNRCKAGNPAFFIPLDPMAEIILEKYNRKLPRYCNEPYNRVLKEIAAILGINKRLTTHTGRKTFATMQESLGWSRESISLMLGHKSVTTTERYYIGRSFARIENELALRSAIAKNHNTVPHR